MKLSTYLQRVRMVTVSVLLTFVTTLPAITHANTTITSFPNSVFNPVTHQAGIPVTASSLPDSILRKQIEKLPATAQTRALNKLRGLSFSSADLPYLRTDRNGGIYIEDHFEIPAYLTNEPQAIAPVYQNITSTEAFSLHSKPGATNTIYLDVNGHVITDTAWNNDAWDPTAAPSYTALPYDLDGNPASFSSSELSSIAQIWRRTAEDFAPFDVDVTTQEPANFINTARALITKNVDQFGIAMPASGAGGVAYLDVWGDNYLSPALIYYNNLAGGQADIVTEAVSHEVGHNLGLSHDGSSTKEYYGGHGTGNTSWGPIMGTGYDRNVSQWSKGEYADANNPEDDVNIIAGYLNHRTDDHSDTSENATPIVTDGSAAGNVISTTPLTDPGNFTSTNKGIIETQGDADTFQFDTTGGTVTLNARSFRETSNTHGGNLDIEIILRDSLGTLVEQNDDTNDTNTTITVPLAAGRYYLTVNGGDDPTSLYSDYGSLGQYFLSGSIPQSGNGNDTTPNAFTFTDQTDVDLSAEIESDDITVSGINAATDISITGGEYSIDGADYVTGIGTVHNGASVSVRHTSSDQNGTDTDTTLTIGGISDTFTSTTKNDDTALYTLSVGMTGDGTIYSDPDGIDCTQDTGEKFGRCSAEFAEGENVELFAEALPGYVFDRWQSGCSGTEPSCTLLIEAAQEVSATFVKGKTLVVETTGDGTGNVTSTPDGIDCGNNSDCEATFINKADVTLTATPDEGSKFAGWIGCTSKTNICKLGMKTDKAISAKFIAIHTLSVDIEGNGSGTVTSKPAGINCSSDCTEGYLSGTKVTLSAKATTGSKFIEWSGACTGTSTCTVTMNEATQVIAKFDKIMHKLTVNKVGNGTINSSPAGINCGDDCIEDFLPKTSVTLTATPDANNAFAGWTGCKSKTNVCTISMTAAKTVTANFKPAFMLNVTLSGSGSGVVTSKPAGLNCGIDCDENYVSNTKVTLSAKAAKNSSFAGWTGACVGTKTCSVTMAEAKNVTAMFNLK